MGTPTEELEQLVDGIYGHWLTKDELRSAITSYSKAMEADALRWIPVTESTPKFDQVVLVDGGVAYYGLTGKWMTITGEEWPGKPIQWKVTHWMSLPALAQEATVPREGEV